MRNQRIRVPMPQLVARLQHRHPFHVLPVLEPIEDLHPVVDGLYNFPIDGKYDAGPFTFGLSAM